jgi:hypothetical protein
MPRTLKDILDERAGSLVGRDRELSELLRLVDDDGPLVAMVHGLAGAGKSTLLRALAARARGQGAVVVQLDGAEIEPTPGGFLSAVVSVIGGPLPTTKEAAGRLAAQGPRSLLVVDTLERLRLLDDWLRRSLVPALPDNVRIVLAGRDPLSPAWTGALGELLSSLALGNLPAPDARRMLRSSGVAEHDVDRLNRLAHGHPLSLRLAASALAARPELSVDQVALPAVVAELTRLYLEGLAPATRRALDAAAVVRRPTRSVMAAMLAEDGEDAWRRLGGLPFAEAGPDGLVLHDTVREAVDAALAAADPQRRRRLRVAAFTQLQSEVREATPAELWRYTSDLLFLADNPLIRDGFFPAGGAAFSIETAAKPTARRSSRSWSATRVGRPRGSPAPGGRPCRTDSASRATAAGLLRGSPSCAIAETWGRTWSRATPLPHAGATTCAAGRCRTMGACCSCAICSPTREVRSSRPPRRLSGSTPSACIWSCVQTSAAPTSQSTGSTRCAACSSRSASRSSPVQRQSSAAAPITPWSWTSDPPPSTAGSRGSWLPNWG